MELTDMLKLVAGLLFLLVVLALYAIGGAASFAVAAAVIAGVAYLLGLVAIGVAQAIFITILAAGAVIGVLIGILQLVAMGA